MKTLSYDVINSLKIEKEFNSKNLDKIYIGILFKNATKRSRFYIKNITLYDTDTNNIINYFQKPKHNIKKETTDKLSVINKVSNKKVNKKVSIKVSNKKVNKTNSIKKVNEVEEVKNIIKRVPKKYKILKIDL